MAKKRLFDLSDVHLYCVTTPPKPGRNYHDMVESALKGGADAVQLREKDLSARELIRLAKDLQALCDRFGALFFLNDRVDAAFAADVDGVHLGQEDLPIRTAREILGHRKLIGASCHSTAQALAAHGDGADYVSCGPLFATPTKPDYRPVTLDLIAQYRQVVRLPFVAIGGIDGTNVEQVIRAGADRVAVVRAVCGADDPEAAARSIKERILRVKAERVSAMALG
jgi:thiamine-phosphate pyrophosphorylase